MFLRNVNPGERTCPNAAVEFSYLMDVRKLVSIPSVPQKAQFPAGGRGKRVISAIVKKLW